MKARVKARVKSTGEIVEVVFNGFYYESIKDEMIFDKSELDIMPKTKCLDYWTRLEHQYAGMAMQGMLSNTSLMSMLFDATKDHDELLKEVVICSHEYAHALVEKMKETK